MLQGGMGATALGQRHRSGVGAEHADPGNRPRYGRHRGGTALATGTVSMDARVKAKMQGYEGDPCGECGNYTLVRNGTCMKCNTCGGTSGCS